MIKFIETSEHKRDIPQPLKQEDALLFVIKPLKWYVTIKGTTFKIWTPEDRSYRLLDFVVIQHVQYVYTIPKALEKARSWIEDKLYATRSEGYLDSLP